MLTKGFAVRGRRCLFVEKACFGGRSCSGTTLEGTYFVSSLFHSARYFKVKVSMRLAGDWLWNEITRLVTTWVSWFRVSLWWPLCLPIGSKFASSSLFELWNRLDVLQRLLMTVQLSLMALHRRRFFFLLPAWHFLTLNGKLLRDYTNLIILTRTSSWFSFYWGIIRCDQELAWLRLQSISCEWLDDWTITCSHYIFSLRDRALSILFTWCDKNWGLIIFGLCTGR